MDWELDVWGRIRAGQAAAKANAESMAADYRYSQYSLAAGVARAYLMAIEARLQIDLKRQARDALAETARIVDVQYENGMVSSLELTVSRSDLATSEAALVAAEGSHRNAVRALELLLGRYPSADLEVTKALPKPPPLPPSGVPSEILERRPDLVAAERRVAAAFNSLDEAKAATLPRISLTGSAGGSSNQLTTLMNPANLGWSLGANLLAPLFDGGARKAQVEAATAEQKQVLAQYGQTALQVFQEVETALDQNVVLRDQGVALTQAANEAHESLRVTRQRHEMGEIELLDVLNIQHRVFRADGDLLSNQRARLEQWVNLNLALGGSWHKE
jgi:NodT family efflux transporter outer membrane factor (OMF) lipoprotein